ncbi:unnamed protein product [Sphagnum balticum]
MSARFSLSQGESDNYSSTAGCCSRRVFAVTTSSRRRSPLKLPAAVHRLPFATLNTFSVAVLLARANRWRADVRTHDDADHPHQIIHIRTVCSVSRFHSLCRNKDLLSHPFVTTPSRVGTRNYLSLSFILADDKMPTRIIFYKFMCDVCDTLFDDEYTCTIHERNHGRDEYEQMRARDDQLALAVRKHNRLPHDEHTSPPSAPLAHDDTQLTRKRAAKYIKRERDNTAYDLASTVEHVDIEPPAARARRTHEAHDDEQSNKHAFMAGGDASSADGGGGDGDESVLCPTCGRRFVRMQVMLRHQQVVHSDERMYKCDICETDYNRADTLKGHFTSKKHRERARPINDVKWA